VSSGREREAPLLDAATVSQLERMSFAPLDALLDQTAGDRRTRRRAPGIEFEDHRAYVPGDDLRSLDWNAYARLRETVVRTSAGEGRLAVALLLDTSRSMIGGGSGNLRYAARLAAVLGAVALLHADTVTVFTLADGCAVSYEPLGGRVALQELVGQLERLSAGGGTDLAASLTALAGDHRAADVAVLVSDLMARVKERALASLAALAPATTVAHVVDPAAAHPAPAGALELRDSETGERLTLRLTAATGERYAEAFESHARAIAEACARQGIGYIRCPIDVEPVELLVASFRPARVLHT
jgi:uncharacterized protein (DUF58 family)